jgi:hypothetical protein
MSAHQMLPLWAGPAGSQSEHGRAGTKEKHHADISIACSATRKMPTEAGSHVPKWAVDLHTAQHGQK